MNSPTQRQPESVPYIKERTITRMKAKLQQSEVEMTPALYHVVFEYGFAVHPYWTRAAYL